MRRSGRMWRSGRVPIMRLVVGIAIGILAGGVWLGGPALAQPARPGQPPGQPQPAPVATVTPAITVDPNQVGATPHWTITIGAAYCGGYRVGDGVYLSPEPPLALPSTLPDGSALFSGQPASVDWINGALRIGPGAGLVQSMICMVGQRPLNIELLPEAGLALPADPGDYAVDVWTGADSTPVTLSFTVPGPDDSAATSAPEN
jgi:hypothetical protein